MKQAIFVIFLSIFIIFLNLFPNFYALINAPQGYAFSGQASWFDPWDINAYASAIKFGQSGNILLKNVYTTEANNGVLIYPVYTISGLLFPFVNQFFLFHILSILGTIILIFAVFKCCSYFLPRPQNYLATTLITLAGGIGWLIYPQVASADLFMTGFTFVSHFQRAHEAIGVTFYLLSLIFFFISTRSAAKKYFYISLISLIFTIFFYPYYLISFTVIAIIYTNIIYFKEGKVSFLGPLLLEIVIASGFTFIYYQHLVSNPSFSSVLSQSLATPNIMQILLGYGLLVPLYIFQLFYGKRDQKYFFLNTWFISCLLLSFLPFGFARFFLRLLLFPLIILIILSLKEINIKLSIKPKIILILMFILLPISALFITYKRIDEVKSINHWYYLTHSETLGLEFLEKNPPAGILTSYAMGNIIPAKTGQAVYFGHLIQTPKSEEKINRLMLFYANAISDAEAKDFLNNNHIGLIYYGPEEKKITQDYAKTDKLEYSFLKSVFQNGDVSIFKF